MSVVVHSFQNYTRPPPKTVCYSNICMSLNIVLLLSSKKQIYILAMADNIQRDQLVNF